MQPTLQNLIHSLKNVEPFPGVATTVLQWAGRKDLMPSDLVKVVQTDPGLTAKVLRLSNSAYYGFQEQLSSLHDAGTRLGVNVLSNLIVTTCGNRYFRDYGGQTGADSADLWTRSVTNAMSAKLIAETHGNCDPETAYTVALLQDIGSIVVERFLAECRDEIIAEARSCGSLLDAERRVLGLNHAEIGARLAVRWNLPPKLVDAIHHHHTPERASVDPILAGTAHLAETLSWAVGAGAGLDDLTFDVSAAALAITGLEMDALRELDGELGHQLAQAQEFLAA